MTQYRVIATDSGSFRGTGPDGVIATHDTLDGARAEVAHLLAVDLEDMPRFAVEGDSVVERRDGVEVGRLTYSIQTDGGTAVAAKADAAEYGVGELVSCGLDADGCEVFAVRRAFPRPELDFFGDVIATHYWIVVVQTMPGKRKLVSRGDSRRFYGSYRPEWDRDAAVARARSYIEHTQAVATL